MPLGAFRLNSLAKVIGSTASWQTYDYASSLDTAYAYNPNNNQSSRSLEFISDASNDYFYVLTSNPTSPYLFKQYHQWYPTSGGTQVDFYNYTDITSNMSLNFTQSQTLTFPSYDKIIATNGTAYTPMTINGDGSLTVTSTYSVLSNAGSVNSSRYCIFSMPGDETKVYYYDEDGDIAYYTWDNSTNTLTYQANLTTNGIKPANASRIVVFATDTGGTKRIAQLYWDSSYGGFKVAHYSYDLSTLVSTTSLGTQTAPAGTPEKYGNMKQDLNRGLYVSIKTVSPGDAVAFLVTWNGSTFTKNSELTISNPVSGSYPTGYTTGALFYLGDDVYASLIGFNNASNYRAMNLHMLKINTDNSVTQLGWHTIAEPLSVQSPNARNGISLSRDGSAMIAGAEYDLNKYAVRYFYKST